MYFSSRGFTFEPIYRKTVLSSPPENLAGKAAYLLQLSDSLVSLLETRGIKGVNLHRHPEWAEYLEDPQRLPSTWKGILYIQTLHLGATEDKAVYAESNKIRTERTYSLYFEAEGRFRNQTLRWRKLLPPDGWKQVLLTSVLETMLSQ
ncbi:MAG: hypothetical protein N2170_02055 [Bacteroidia bacterium]|nr:hypothetical protein [Bacteroidia bacterium]